MAWSQAARHRSGGPEPAGPEPAGPEPAGCRTLQVIWTSYVVGILLGCAAAPFAQNA